MRDAGVSEWCAAQPGVQAGEVDRGGDQQVLHFGFREAAVATSSQVECPHSLGDGALDPGAVTVDPFPLVGFLELA